MSAAQAIESVVLAYVSALCSNHDPSPTLSAPPLRARGPAGDFFAARSQLLTLRTLSTCYELLRKSRTASVREVYYLHAGIMEDAGEATDAIAAAQRALGGLPRHALGLFASGRGLYAGLLSVGGQLAAPPAPAAGGPPPRARALPILSDCVCAPAGVAPAGARFILVVEKAAIFQRLVEDRVWTRAGLECALVTGCGQPDLATRAFLRQVVDAHPAGTPVLGLVDFNPFGLGILLTYARGSAAHPEANAYAVPELAWLGLRGCDLEEHALPRSVLQPLTLADERRVTGLLGDPTIAACATLTGEVERWVEEGVKAELEALMALGVEYLVDEFLPRKLGGVGAGGGIDALPLARRTAAAPSAEEQEWAWAEDAMEGGAAAGASESLAGGGAPPHSASSSSGLEE